MAAKKLDLSKLENIELQEEEKKPSKPLRGNKKDRTVSTTLRYTEELKFNLELIKLHTNVDKQDLMFKYIIEGVERDMKELKEKGTI